MHPLVLTLLANGPSMLRMAGNLFGGKTKAIADGVAGVMDAAQGKSAVEQRHALEKHINQLSVEDIEKLNAVKIRLEELAIEREKNRQVHEQVMHSETQQTARAEQEHGNDFVKETRPKIARQSFLAGTIYILVAESARIITSAWGGDISGADWTLAAALFAPCGGYIGVRSWDKMKEFNR